MANEIDTYGARCQVSQSNKSEGKTRIALETSKASAGVTH